MSNPISGREYLLRDEVRIEGNRFFINSNDQKGVALVSKIFLDTMPKDTLWNKILKFLGVGYWSVLTIKNTDNTLTYVKVNGNSWKKFAEINKKDFPLNKHPDQGSAPLGREGSSPQKSEYSEGSEKPSKETTPSFETPLRDDTINRFDFFLQTRFQGKKTYEIFLYNSIDQLSNRNLLPLNPFEADALLKISPNETALIHRGSRPHEWMLSFKDKEGKITHRACNITIDPEDLLDIPKGLRIAVAKKQT